MPLSVIELFAGAGGMALGLERAGLENTALIEINKDAVATLKYNRPKWNVIQADICSYSFAGMKADVVTGGFPCQAFSYAGKGNGLQDKRGALFYEFVRCVREIKPKLFLAENVAGLISHGKGQTLKTILSTLQSLGYKVQYRLLDALNYDVPQRRKRVIIVGTRKGINFEYLPPKSHILTLKDALVGVPLSEGLKYGPAKLEVMKLVPPGGCWRDLPEEVRKNYAMKSYRNGGGCTGMARRMSWNQPSLTLTTSPSQKHTERCHPEETRPFHSQRICQDSNLPRRLALYWWNNFKIQTNR